LVERIPLEVGENETPIGTILVGPDHSARLRIAPGEPAVTRAGEPVVGELYVAVEDGAVRPDVFEHAGRRYDLVVSASRLSMRVRDPNAPALRHFPGIPVYPIDLAWRLAGRFEPLPRAAMELVPRTDGRDALSPRVGRVELVLDGTVLVLAVYLEESTGRWFIPFADATSGSETYGAGRSLMVEPPAAGELMQVDFNLAFNLPCAFNALVACPLPPAHNRLPVAIRAGERTPTAPTLQ
jgi:hypothetical protein